jgi:hypothetical protein
MSSLIQSSQAFIMRHLASTSLHTPRKVGAFPPSPPHPSSFSGFSEQAETIPRQKLANLTLLQFQELCMDVYDELIRRQNNSETVNSPGGSCLSSLQIVPAHPYPALVPFLQSLPAQAGFYPNRNQAREKLATLRPSRFQELTRDVRHEMGRRYPACNEVVLFRFILTFPFFLSRFRRPPLPAQRMIIYLSLVSRMFLPDAIEIYILGARLRTIQVAG